MREAQWLVNVEYTQSYSYVSLYTVFVLIVLQCHLVLNPSPPTNGTVTKIETLSPVSAKKMLHSLGFNVDPSHNWELVMAKEAGAIEIRMQPSWNKTEIDKGRYIMPPAILQALHKAAELNLEPLLVAAYGPPWHRFDVLTVANPVPIGSTTIPIMEKAQLAKLLPYYDYVMKGNQQIVVDGYWAYPGSPIAAINNENGTFILDAPTAITLNQGNHIIVNRRLYPPPATTNEKTDPSIRAYGNYVLFLARTVASLAKHARIEIWNEPPWKHDLWDDRACFHYPRKHNCKSPNYTIARFLMSTNPPPNVRYNWAGTHKTGFYSVLDPKFIPAASKQQVLGKMSSESFHPYGPVPESSAWDPACLEKASMHNVWPCALEGTSHSSNFKVEAKISQMHLKEQGWTIERNITEVGLPTTNNPAKARYILRAFITYSALGYKRINLYRIADDDNYGLVDVNTKRPYLAYIGIKGFLDELKSYTEEPLLTPGNRPSVVAYQGSWPLTVVPIPARHSNNDPKNTYFLALWQRTYAEKVEQWINLATPKAALATIKIQPGYKLTSARDPIYQTCIPYSLESNGLIKIAVGADPVILKIEPITD